METKPIDWKYKINALNPCSNNIHSEYDSILFLAHDKAVPHILYAYLNKCKDLKCDYNHIKTVELLIERIKDYQSNIDSKIPDTDLPCEIERCILGKGLEIS